MSERNKKIITKSRGSVWYVWSDKKKINEQEKRQVVERNEINSAMTAVFGWTILSENNFLCFI